MNLAQVDPSGNVETSVVIPAYNSADHLWATMASVLAQRDVVLELLVVDDCSTDGTTALVAAAAARDTRVRYFRMPTNCGGPAGPRNLGLREARSPWVALCDADDLWHPNKLRIQLDLAIQKNADLVCSAIEDFTDNKPPALSGKTISAQVPAHRLTHWQMLLKNRIATSSVLCRRDALRGAGGFETAGELVAVEDYDLWLRLMSQPGFKVMRIAVPLVAYRRLPQSLSISKWRMATKAMRVLQRAARRGGWSWAYPLALPLLLASYTAMSIYWRILKGRM